MTYNIEKQDSRQVSSEENRQELRIRYTWLRWIRIAAGAVLYCILMVILVWQTPDNPDASEKTIQQLYGSCGLALCYVLYTFFVELNPWRDPFKTQERIQRHRQLEKNLVTSREQAVARMLRNRFFRCFIYAVFATVAFIVVFSVLEQILKRS